MELISGWWEKNNCPRIDVVMPVSKAVSWGRRGEGVWGKLLAEETIDYNKSDSKGSLTSQSLSSLNANN